MSSTVGFIGIGSMGWPMAARLVAAGHRVVVFDVNAERCRSFAREIGGVAAATPAEAAGGGLVVTMLPSSDVVEAALHGPTGIFSGLPRGALILEMSSGSPMKTRAFAAEAEAREAILVDAPVSGGVPRAVTGELAIMVGGPQAAIERAAPVLRAMGSSITPTGATGSAHAMKALNNLVSAAGFLIGVEAMLIGQRFGIDPGTIVDVLNVSTGVNNSTQKKFKQFVLSRKFDAGFGLDLMVKDISIATALAHATGTPAPFAEVCHGLWTQAAEVLGRGRDHTELARYCEELSNAELGALPRADAPSGRNSESAT
jgi:3-hydroxyisobutyrate dehydrogenase